MLGGQSIAIGHALFDLATYEGAIVTDLFAEDRYFADPDTFWAAQNVAIEARRAAFLEAGRHDAIVVPPSEHFQAWEYEKAPKRKGGRVNIDVRASGEVIVHEGYVSRREASKAARGTESKLERPARPEITSAMQTYCDLHRHAAVRAALVDHPNVALRLMLRTPSPVRRSGPSGSSRRPVAPTRSAKASRRQGVKPCLIDIAAR